MSSINTKAVIGFHISTVVTLLILSSCLDDDSDELKLENQSPFLYYFNGYSHQGDTINLQYDSLDVLNGSCRISHGIGKTSGTSNYQETFAFKYRDVTPPYERIHEIKFTFSLDSTLYPTHDEIQITSNSELEQLFKKSNWSSLETNNSFVGVSRIQYETDNVWITIHDDANKDDINLTIDKFEFYDDWYFGEGYLIEGHFNSLLYNYYDRNKTFYIQKGSFKLLIPAIKSG